MVGLCPVWVLQSGSTKTNEDRFERTANITTTAPTQKCTAAFWQIALVCVIWTLSLPKSTKVGGCRACFDHPLWPKARDCCKAEADKPIQERGTNELRLGLQVRTTTTHLRFLQNSCPQLGPLEADRCAWDDRRLTRTHVLPYQQGAGGQGGPRWFRLQARAAERRTHLPQHTSKGKQHLRAIFGLGAAADILDTTARSASKQQS